MPAFIHCLFGDKIAVNGVSYSNGFEALQKLTAKDCSSEELKARYFGPWDEQYADLIKVWVDKNRNGKSDEGELKTLEDSGILAINACNIVHAQAEDGYGNGTKLRSALLVRSAGESVVSESEILNRLETGYRSNSEKADFRVAIDVYFKANKHQLCQFNVKAEEVKVNREEDLVIDEGIPRAPASVSTDEPI